MNTASAAELGPMRKSTPKARDADLTRKRILSAATAEFGRKGLGGARVDEIARRSKSNQRMIYHYFGSKELLFSNEITFPILSGLGIRGVIFADAGQSFRLKDSLDISKLQAALGVGVRWKSPFGPLAVDIAFPLNPRPADQNTVFEIGAGSPL